MFPVAHFRCFRVPHQVERLFVLPQYCGILLEQSLMHNRRRNDLEDIPKTKRLKPDPSLDDSVSTSGTAAGARARVCVCGVCVRCLSECD